ncbi:MAG: phosphoadenosine phosphosulfate reductase family protein [Methanobacteriota archaeon]|nr:MAG: phosphoadenosine phosphosulfate reductase family protein [Euryarchaeota archaeon]
MRTGRTGTRLYWCDQCNVPLIGSSCGKCGSGGRRVPLSPPGDVRLALEGTRKKLQYLFLRDFGVRQMVRDVVLLNKTSGDDRAEEVIVDGQRVAQLRYDLESREHELILRLGGARMLASLNSRKQVTLRKAEGHMKGKYLPPDSIESVDPDIRAGDEVVIRMGKFTGCGTAKVDAGAIRRSEKGVKVRDFAKEPPFPPSGKKVWTRMLVKANQPHLVAKKAKAEREIREAVSSRKLPLTVSFSGGKDSLVVLDLARAVTRELTVIFIDTGLEHRHTRDYVETFARENGIRLLRASAGSAFDDNFDVFGPPAKDFRWCCKVCKLAPVSALVEEKYPKGTVTVEGNRRLESFARSHITTVGDNPFVPRQVTVNPIRDWTALDVWLYIIWRELKYNPLYDEDVERVGCWMCPSALASEFEEISKTLPELARWWELRLLAWADEHQLPPEFVRHGFWRWKQPPPKMRALASRLNIDVKPVRADTMRLRVLKGVSPCAAGGYSVEAVLEMPKEPTLERVGEMLKVIGEVRLSEEFGVAMVDSGTARLRVFSGGQIAAVGRTPDEAEALFGSAARAALRAGMCTKCSICEKACRHGAISVRDDVTISEDLCTHCGECVESCVVAHYLDKLAADQPGTSAASGRRRRKR